MRIRYPNHLWYNKRNRISCDSTSRQNFTSVAMIQMKINLARSAQQQKRNTAERKRGIETVAISQTSSGHIRSGDFFWLYDRNVINWSTRSPKRTRPLLICIAQNSGCSFDSTKPVFIDIDAAESALIFIRSSVLVGLRYDLHTV